MIAAMPKARYPHLERYKTRHEKFKWYFRLGKGPRIRLPDDYGSKAFVKAYGEALANATKQQQQKPLGHTLGWLIAQYEDSPAFKLLAKETRKQFRYQFKKMKLSGELLLKNIDTARIVKGRDNRADKPTDANKYVKASRKLFDFAVERCLVPTNPTTGVKLLPRPNRVQGFHAWTEDEVQAFEGRWPLGTRERLALDLLLYTGVRRSDVVRLGRQHVRNGVLKIKTEKSVNMGHPVDVEISILPPLVRSIEATKTGDMAFLVTAKGTPFGKESFGTWFKKACVAAGVPGAAHGLRKIAAQRCAENGATEAELNAMFGWADGSKESSTYVRKANRAKLARSAIVKMLPTPSEILPTPKGKSTA